MTVSFIEGENRKYFSRKLTKLITYSMKVEPLIRRLPNQDSNPRLEVIGVQVSHDKLKG